MTEWDREDLKRVIFFNLEHPSPKVIAVRELVNLRYRVLALGRDEQISSPAMRDNLHEADDEMRATMQSQLSLWLEEGGAPAPPINAPNDARDSPVNERNNTEGPSAPGDHGPADHIDLTASSDDKDQQRHKRMRPSEAGTVISPVRQRRASVIDLTGSDDDED